MSNPKQTLSPLFLAKIANRLNIKLAQQYQALPALSEGVNIRYTGSLRRKNCIEVTFFKTDKSAKYGFTNSSLFLFSDSSKKAAKSFERIVVKYLNDECTYEELKEYSGY